MILREQVQCRCNENSGEPVRPSLLAGSIADLIVTNLDHGRRQAARVGMARDRIIDLIAR